MKFLARLIIFVFLPVLIFAACGDSTATTVPAQSTATVSSSTGNTSSITATPAAPNATPATANKVKVTWWHIQTDVKAKAVWQTMANTYMAAHPNVTIEISVFENEAFKTKLATAMQANTPPDLFQSWGGGVMMEYAKAGLIKDISSDLNGAWGNSFNKSALDVYSFKGKYYGAPWDMGMVGFFYNKALFTKAGITAPPATWKDFLADVKLLKAAGITPIALDDKEKWPGHFYWVYLAMRHGGQDAFNKAYSRTGSFSDPSFVQAGKDIQDLVALDPFPKGFLQLTYQDQSTLMGDGKAGMELMGQWGPQNEKDFSTSKKGIGTDLGFFPFPAVEGGAGAPTDVMGGGNGIAVGKNAAPEAVDFLRFLTNIDNQRTLAAANYALPTVKGADDAVSDPLQKQLLASLAKAQYFQLYYDQYLPPAVGDSVKDATQGLFAGTSSPEEAAKQIEDSAATTITKAQ